MIKPHDLTDLLSQTHFRVGNELFLTCGNCWSHIFGFRGRKLLSTRRKARNKVVFRERKWVGLCDLVHRWPLRMPDILGLPAYTVDWQHLVCLLYALNELGAGGHRRQDVCEFIQRHHYLSLTPDDVAPYPTQSEPSWQTDIAYARKIGVIMGIIGFDERDSWEIIRDGREQLLRILAAGDAHAIDGRRCFLWSRDFRRVLDRTYEPSAADAPRPPRRPRGIADYDARAKAREFVASGRAARAAAFYSQKLGFCVSPDVRSLAFAVEMHEAQMLRELFVQ
jgi:hypothetical protein